MSDHENASEPQTKDLFDRIDLIGKLVSSVLISGILGFFIQKSAQKIAFSIETGKLTQSLISDLSASNPENQLRQEIALAALDGSIGDDKSELVANVAERIVASKSGVDAPTAKYALEVLKRRNPKRYQEIVKQQAQVIQSLAARNPAESTTQSSASSPIATPEQVNAVSQAIARTFNGIVFIQYQNGDQKRALDQLKSELMSQGMSVPNLEQVEGKYANSIRYFSPDDLALAAQIKAIVESHNADPEKSFEILDYSSAGYNVPQGQIEIWVGH